jgi:hypothetical protein
MQIDFKAKLPLVPRDEKGDPALTWNDLTRIFNEAETVEMVNRYLYYYEYQRNSHKNFNQRRRDKLAPVKHKVRQMFGVGWDKATPEQIERVVQALKAAEKGGPTGT